MEVGKDYSEDSIGALRLEAQVLGDKLNELEMDADEHRLVIAALEPLPAARKCWRRVGGILVESNVSGTLPILETNLKGIEKTLQGLKEAFRNKMQELEKLERR